MSSNIRITCQGCSSTDLVITDGSGPHFRALRCNGCSRFIKWLSSYQTKQLKGIFPEQLQGSLFDGGQQP